MRTVNNFTVRKDKPIKDEELEETFRRSWKRDDHL